MIHCLLFDLGETLTEKMIDSVSPLDELPLVAFHDAIPTLERLKNQGYKLAVISNTCQSGDLVVSRAIERIGLRHFFDAVVTSVDAGCEKPAPKIFLDALDRVSCHPSESVMIGDNPIADIDGASKLGLRTILIQRGSLTSSSQGGNPSFIVSSLSEIPAIVCLW